MADKLVLIWKTSPKGIYLTQFSALSSVLSQGPAAAQVRGWQERGRSEARSPIPGGRQPGNLSRGRGHPQAAGPRPAEQESHPRRPPSGPRARGHPGPRTCQ